MTENIKKILSILTQKEKTQCIYLIILTLFMSIVEMFGVASILPFMSIMIDPELIQKNKILTSIYIYFEFENNNDFLFFSGISVFFLFILSLFLKGFVNIFQIKFVLDKQYSISQRLFEKYIHKPYSWFLNQHSSDITKNIFSEISVVVSGILRPILQFITYMFVSISLIILLLFINPSLTIKTATFLAVSYFSIFFFVKNFLKKIGKKRVISNKERFRILNDAFAGIKVVKFMNLENLYSKLFTEPSKNFYKTQLLSSSISIIPRYFLEAVAFGGILLISVIILKEDNFKEAIPILALYAFAGIRLLPAIQQIYSSLSQINFSLESLDQIHENLKVSKKKNILDKNIELKNLNFQRYIELQRINFKYEKSDYSVLKDISFKIKKGSSTGIVGHTGSGKTTLIDIILGLIKPNSGSIKIDNCEVKSLNIKNWKNIIGYVPQKIFLKDDTIASNIAFGKEKKDIDIDHIHEILKIVNLYDFVNYKLNKGIYTMVGEAGVKLSGGECQRVGIARALYNSPEILIFDEATSDLDNITEKIIMDCIDKLKNKMTIIMVAHRLNSLRKCDNILLLDQGKLLDQGNFNKLLNKNELFKKMNL